MKNRLVLVNSAIAFALALLVMIMLHEFAHGIAALTQGQRPVVLPGSEQDHATTTSAIVLIALAGPVWSLVSGAVVLALPQLSPSRAFWRLAVLWFGLLSVQEFSGYLFIGVFAKVGDIGQTYEVLGTPIWIQLAVSVAGFLMTFVTGRIATRRFLELSVTGPELAPRMRQLGLFAWLVGAGIAVALSLPYSTSSLFTTVGIFELLATITSGAFLVSVRFFMKRTTVTSLDPVFVWPIVGIAMLLVVALARILILGPGLTL